MAIVAVKNTKLEAGSGNNASGAVSATAGNALLVGAAAYENTTTGGSFSVARTGDTYTTDIQGDTSAATDIQHIGIASAPNVAGGSVTLTATITGAGQGVVAHVLEVSGLATSSIKDANSPAIKIGTSTAASTNSLTNTTADAIFVAQVGTEAGGNPVTLTAGAGWTDTVTTAMTEKNANTYPADGMAYQIVSATGAKSGAWTVDNADWGGVIAVYKAAAGGAAQDAPELYGRPSLSGQRQLHQHLAN